MEPGDERVGPDTDVAGDGERGSTDDLGELRDARFSADRRYRYWLQRRWDPSRPQFAYVLLNPSRADADHDDPTVRKLSVLTSANGGGGFELVNLFAVMDTRQVGLHLPDAVEAAPGENDRWIERVVERADVVVLGWGDGMADDLLTQGRRAAVRRRAQQVWPLVRNRQPRCFRTIGSGAPGHPGRLRSTAPIVRYHGTDA